MDDDVRSRLLAARDDAVRRLRGLTDDFDEVVAASRDTNGDDEHDPEGATIAFERSQVDALARQARARLVEVDGALARLDSGRYGVCASCGGPVGAERLEARPAAARCITCAAAPGRG